MIKMTDSNTTLFLNWQNLRF